MRSATIVAALALALAGCATKRVDPRGPVPDPVLVEKALERAGTDVRDTATRTRTVTESAERAVARYPQDALIRTLRDQAGEAQRQAIATEQSFEALKAEALKAQAQLLEATDKLRQWQQFYNDEYAKRVKAELSTKRKGKWLWFSGLTNVGLLGGALLLAKLKMLTFGIL